MKTKYMPVDQGREINIQQYPNFHKSGSIKGMKELVYGKEALLVRCGDWIYHVPPQVYDQAR